MTPLELSYAPRPVPLRAVLLSLMALSAPLVGAVWFRDAMGGNDVLLWLTALIPAFLLAYYRGWRGVAVSQSLGMVVLTTTQVILTVSGREMQDASLLLGIIGPYVAISLGIGWISDALHREREAAERRALTDDLTGLPNRRVATLFLRSQFAAARRGRDGLAVVFFDLDHFKSYNDVFGHAAGDEALRAFAAALASQTRASNCAARWGGEEFVAVLRESNVAGAMIFVDRVRWALRRAQPDSAPVTVSAGVAVYHPGLRSPEALVDAADKALYAAKEAGRDCVRVAREHTAAPVPEMDMSLLVPA